MKKNILEFPVLVYGKLEKYNDIWSKARCRIFYKYGNRNGTYITDEFAEGLIKSLPYTPVKGIYSEEEGDFTDHGSKRSEGRIYGITPETLNFAWEKHLDEDGVEREYACADVLLATSLYAEAGEIVEKKQSMELYEPTLKFHKAVIEGSPYIVFDEGSFLGLQVLGSKVEPCFEGASFYTLQKTIEDAIYKIKEFSKEEQSEMKRINFKLSDGEKYEVLWYLLNTDFTEEGGWSCDYAICEVYDDYALVNNYSTGKYERAYYLKDDEKDSIEITKFEVVYIIDVTETEKDTIEALRKLNGDTYEKVSENLENANENATKVEDLDSKIKEYTGSISTLKTKASETQAKLDDVSVKYANSEATVESLTKEVEDLKDYRHSVETQHKEAVVADYVDKLPKEVIKTYTEKLDEYTVLDLDKELAYECKKSNSSIFSAQQTGFIPKDQPLSGIEAILSKYKK